MSLVVQFFEHSVYWKTRLLHIVQSVGKGRGKERLCSSKKYFKMPWTFKNIACFYDIVLWPIYKADTISKLAAAIVTSIKIFFFGYRKFYSVSAVLLELEPPSFKPWLGSMLK